MYEVEVKIEAAHEPIRSRLRALDAKDSGVVHQHDTYYDHPGRSFAHTDEALRLRCESTSTDGATVATLTYKGPLVDDASKTREEVETGVLDPDRTDTLLRAVGFKPAAVVEKERDQYTLEGYEIVLDEVDGLGEFVEIEAVASEAEVASVREGAFELCQRLGLDPDASIQTSYLELLLEDSTGDN